MYPEATMAKKKKTKKKFTKAKKFMLGFLLAVFSGIVANVIFANHEALMEMMQSPFK